MFQKLYLLDSNSTIHFVPTVMYTTFLASKILLSILWKHFGNLKN